MKSTNNYNAWNIKEDNYPSDGTIIEKIKFIVNYGILAPSTHNTQPWKYSIDNDTLTISPDFVYKLKFADPNNRNIYISQGCFLANILIAAKRFSLKADYKYLTINNEIRIRVRFSEEEMTHHVDNNLFKYIPLRFSNKMPYDNIPIANDIVDRITLLSRDFNNVTTTIITDKQKIDEIATMYEKSVIKFSSNKGFAIELSQWLRNSNTQQPDGMPGFIVGMSNLQSLVGKYLIKKFPKVLTKVTSRDVTLLKNSPAIGIISTANDKITDWINAGLLYEYIVLLTTSYNLNSAPMTAIIEDNINRKRLSQLIEKGHKYPQIFFRIGYASNSRYHTPRRQIKVV